MIVAGANFSEYQAASHTFFAESKGDFWHFSLAFTGAREGAEKETMLTFILLKRGSFYLQRINNSIIIKVHGPHKQTRECKRDKAPGKR